MCKLNQRLPQHKHLKTSLFHTLRCEVRRISRLDKLQFEYQHTLLRILGEGFAGSNTCMSTAWECWIWANVKGAYDRAGRESRHIELCEQDGSRGRVVFVVG